MDALQGTGASVGQPTRPLTREEKLAEFKDAKTKHKGGALNPKRPALAGLATNVTHSTPSKLKAVGTRSIKGDALNARTPLVSTTGRKSLHTPHAATTSTAKAIGTVRRTTRIRSRTALTPAPSQATHTRSVSRAQSCTSDLDTVRDGSTSDHAPEAADGVRVKGGGMETLSHNLLDTDTISLQSRLSEESNKSIRFQIELDARANEVSALRSAIVQLQQELHSSRQDQLSQLEAEECLRTEVIERELQIKQLQMDWSVERSALQGRLEDNDQLVDELGQLVAKLREEVESLKSQPQAYADVWIQQVRIEELEAHTQIQDTQIQQNAEILSELRVEIKDCYTAIDGFEEQERSSAVDMLKLQTEIENLTTAGITAESTKFMLERDLSWINEHTQRLEVALRESLVENETIHKENASKDEELKDAYAVIDLLEAQIKDLNEDTELLKIEASKNNELQSEMIIQGIELQRLCSIQIECDELRSALQSALEENKEISVKMDMLKLSNSESLGDQVMSPDDKPDLSLKSTLDHQPMVSGTDAVILSDISHQETLSTTGTDPSPEMTDCDLTIHDCLSCHQASQTEQEFDYEYLDRQIKVLKLAYVVTKQKHEEASTIYSDTLNEVEMRNTSELSKWKNTSAEQKTLIDELWSGILKSADRIKDLELKLQQFNVSDDIDEDEEVGVDNEDPETTECVEHGDSNQSSTHPTHVSPKDYDAI
ncbi:hypothetical protein BSLG_009262 [Batrachochytrium salamandrivorans]|nr:hypothetical protein BSLG_009262 [Batrachochytrium salamandrivorans]